MTTVTWEERETEPAAATESAATKPAADKPEGLNWRKLGEVIFATITAGVVIAAAAIDEVQRRCQRTFRDPRGYCTACGINLDRLHRKRVWKDEL